MKRTIGSWFSKYITWVQNSSLFYLEKRVLQRIGKKLDKNYQNSTFLSRVKLPHTQSRPKEYDLDHNLLSRPTSKSQTAVSVVLL